jgi:hypothetical protein
LGKTSLYLWVLESEMSRPALCRSFVLNLEEEEKELPTVQWELCGRQFVQHFRQSCRCAECNLLEIGLRDDGELTLEELGVVGLREKEDRLYRAGLARADQPLKETMWPRPVKP